MDAETVTCGNCGSEVSAGMRFCPQCGRIMAQPPETEDDISSPSAESGPQTQYNLPPPPRYNDRPQYAPPPPPPPRYDPSVGGAYAPPRYDQLPVPMGYGQTMVGFQCPFCRTTMPPLSRERVSQTGWIVLALLIIFCFPLFWIGLLIKEPYRVCSQCGNTLS